MENLYQISVIQDIATILADLGWQMGTAESCTGGMIAAALTALPGSSQWFAGGLVTYAVSWKEHLLEVPSEVIQQKGVVSEETVEAMLRGLQKYHGVQAGIAVSGIAGPTGAEPGKPVGTVVIGACAGEEHRVETCHFPGDRDEVRAGATAFALQMLQEILKNAQRRSKSICKGCKMQTFFCL